MWDYILVIAVILVVKYLMSGGGGAAIATAPPADVGGLVTVEYLKLLLEFIVHNLISVLIYMIVSVISVDNGDSQQGDGCQERPLFEGSFGSS